MLRARERTAVTVGAVGAGGAPPGPSLAGVGVPVAAIGSGWPDLSAPPGEHGRRPPVGERPDLGRAGVQVPLPSVMTTMSSSTSWSTGCSRPSSGPPSSTAAPPPSPSSVSTQRTPPRSGREGGEEGEATAGAGGPVTEERPVAVRRPRRRRDLLGRDAGPLEEAWPPRPGRPARRLSAVSTSSSVPTAATSPAATSGPTW